MDVEEEGVVRAVMVGSSAGVTMVITMEAALEVTVVVLGPIPGKAEGGWHVGPEPCRSAAVWEVGEPWGWGEIFRERKKRARDMEEGK